MKESQLGAKKPKKFLTDKKIIVNNKEISKTIISYIRSLCSFINTIMGYNVVVPKAN